MDLKPRRVLVTYESVTGNTKRVAEAIAAVIPGAVVLHHGAWFDPAVLDGKEIDVHGNPNSLTQDIPTSSLACGIRPGVCGFLVR